MQFGALAPQRLHHFCRVQSGDGAHDRLFRDQPAELHGDGERVGEPHGAVDVKVCSDALVLQVMHQHALMSDPMHADVRTLWVAPESFVQNRVSCDAAVLSQALSSDARRVEEAEHRTRAGVRLEQQRMHGAVVGDDVPQAVLQFRCVDLVRGHKRVALLVDGETDKLRTLGQHRARRLGVEARVLDLFRLQHKVVLHYALLVGVRDAEHVAEHVDLDLLYVLEHGESFEIKRGRNGADADFRRHVTRTRK
jgi:hypothetical protein